jgi:hypothetical protein
MTTTTMQRLASAFDAAQRSLMMSADPAGYALADGRLDELDPMAQMALADAADRSLLRLVLCAAGSTLLLALATSLL